MSSSASAEPRRVWTIGAAEFDPARRELRRDGVPVRLEPKPLAVLLRLLEQPGEVITKQELLDAVWPGRVVVEAVLANAIAKLRAAIDDTGQELVITVHGCGYRLSPKVRCHDTAPSLSQRLALAPGQPVPGRANWQLTRPAGNGGMGAVWLGAHAKTGERRVFKFCADDVGLLFLKREITLGRTLAGAYPQASFFARVIDWNLLQPPFFAEFEWAGTALPEWAAAQGGLHALNLEQRLGIAAQIAGGVARAHDIGVLHGDLKPDNIACADDAQGLRLRLLDFGSGDLVPSATAPPPVTRMGFGDGAERVAADSGTLSYMAPERLAGGPPTTASDVYALGVILLQLVTADLRRPFAPGWEADISDELLRADIACAAHIDPAQRLPSARDLELRLRHLAERRAEAAREAERQARERALRQRLERNRARLPWLAGIGAASLAALLASLWALWQVDRARQQARLEADSTRAVLQFLSDDLFSAANPSQGGRGDIQLVDAVAQSLPQLERRFEGRPQVEAIVRREMGLFLEAFRSKAAAEQLRRSIALAEGAFGKDDVRVRSTQALLARHLAESGDVDGAAEQLAALGLAPDDAGGGLDDGVIAAAYVVRFAALNRCEDALTVIEALQAADVDGRNTEVIDELAGAHASCLARLGRIEASLAVLHASVSWRQRHFGPEHPRTLYARINHAQGIEDAGRFDEAVAAYRALHDIVLRRFGETDLVTVHFLNAFGRALLRLGEAQKAIPVLRRAHAAVVADERLKDGHQVALPVRLHLAQALAAAGDPRGGVALLEQVDVAAQDVAAADIALLATARMALGFLLERAGDYALARRQADEALVLASRRAELADLVVSIQLLKASVLLESGEEAQARTLVADIERRLPHVQLEPASRQALEQQFLSVRDKLRAAPVPQSSNARGS